MVAEERLPHPNPHRCADPDCGNRATLRLTLVTGEQVTVCRPTASRYPRAEPDRRAVRSVGEIASQTADLAPEPVRFRPTGQHDLAPSGEVERIRANLDAVRALARQLQQQRPATADEQVLYARWSGWGATPGLFDERPKYAGRFAAERAELRALLGEDGYRAARTTTLNAHYTDAAYVQVIWDAVTRLGFTGGRVLEPGCGSGNFLGSAPPDARIVGVELDPTTAQIAQSLYPDAEIRTESFADTRLPEPGCGFDLVIGNVPFGSHKLHDPRSNPGRAHSIHNHFILKALHATRPGGLVALITSRFTMDGVDAAHRRAREQMGELADLVGAVRLPADAHQAAAGTEVVTDLLVLRRRPEGPSTAAAPAWLRTRAVELPAARDSVTADTFEVNEYFLDRPEMVLGEQLTDSGRGRPVLTVRAGDPDTAVALAAALDRLVPAPQVVVRASEPQLQEGLFLVDGNGRFSQVRDGRPVRHEPPRTQAAELRALIALRETALALLDEEATHRDDTPRMASLRTELNTRYDAYVTKFGAINRFQRSTGTRTDRETGEVVETERRVTPRMGGFRDDPYFPYVAALEKFDEESGQAEKAEVFAQRVIAVPVPAERVDTPDDALVVCWDRHNEVRLDVIASLLGLDNPQQAREALGDLVFDEPGSGTLVRKAEYLSGNVRRKLAAAERAATADPAFEVNVQALRSVVPRDLTPAEISARLGSPWIAATYVQQFLREILEDDSVTVSNVGARWTVADGHKKGVLATTVWGTRSRSATDLAQNLLNSQTIEITTTIGSGTERRTVRDVEATAFAQAKAQQLDERFRTWLWEDPDRADTLSRTYNDRFNARVPRSYEGEHVEAPGMSAAFQLRPHQMAAVARIRNTPGVGLFHGTGAGKTLEMIVGGMELVRLRLVRKPCYVVPKGVLGQFRREFLQAYPRAKVLAADTEDLKGDKRRQFVARCSTGDWDAIVISHNAFKLIPVSRDVRVAYLNKQADRLRKHLANSDGADRYTVKDIEKQVQTLDEQIKEQLAAPSDPGVEFERTGIGYLFIDEAHVYKNLRVISSIKDLAIDGNQITADLEMKLEYLRRTSRRVVTLATATPIDNSPSEILTMTKYAAPELLAEMGIEEDDQYHAAFIQPRRRVEMRPDGSGFQSRVRYARYVNLTEQKQLMYSWADVKLKEHLDLGEPAIIGGQPEVLSVPASVELHEHLVALAERAKDVTAGRPAERLTTTGELKKDNILWISTDGRTASLDLRLIGDHTDTPQKIDIAADRLVEIWREHRDDVYYRPDGTPEPHRGSLQLVFCDLGVPRRGRWSVYEGLRDELVARGMPADQIRFAQDARNRREKDQLDQDARDGKIAVLIGSRQGLGTGRNIQRRVITVLQLDPTWKLTPVTQSLGRGQRQGNDNEAIHHIFVVTENSYDPFLWQKVDDKARFTRQMLDPNDTTRIIDAQEQDDDGGKIDPAVMFAVAAGRPELLELHRTEEAVGALRLEQRIWGNEQVTLKVTVEQNRRSIASLRRDISDLDTVLARRRDTRGDAFRIILDGATFDSRSDAGGALVRRLRAVVHAGHGRQQLQLGQLGGIALSASIEPGLLEERVLLRLDGIPDSMIELNRRYLDALAAGGSAKQVGLIRSLENAVTGADKARQRMLDSIDLLQVNIDRASARIGLPFPRQADLDRYTSQLAELHKQLQILDDVTPDGDAAGTSTTASDHGTDEPAAGTADANLSAAHAIADAPRPADIETSVGNESAPVDTGPTTLPELLEQANLPADQRRWVIEHLQQVVDEPHTQTIASANDYERARLVLDDKLDRIFADAVDAYDIDGADLAARYFDGDTFRRAFREMAGVDLYRRARAAAEIAARPYLTEPVDTVVSDQPSVAPEAMREERGQTLHTRGDVSGIQAAPAGVAAVADTSTADPVAELGGDLTHEFTGGNPYTSRNRIRGPLASVKQSANALLRTRGWSRTSTVGNVGALNAAIDELKGMAVDRTDPTALLSAAVRLYRQTRVMWQARHTHGVDPVFATLNELSRMGGTFVRDLIATAATPGRWQRVFGQDPPALRPDSEAHLPVETDPPATPVADREPGTTDDQPSPGTVERNEPPKHTAGPLSAIPVRTVDARTDTAVEPSPEQRLMDKVAARIPDDVIQPSSAPGGHASVLLAFVANGTYGEVTGVDLQRQPVTASGYVLEAHGLRGGYGGWHPGTMMVVRLGELPDGPVTHTVQTEMDGRLTVLDPPRPDMPAGETAPWLRMPVEEQILAARTALGLTVEVRDGPANELWTVQGCREQITGEVAWWLFGGTYRSWEGRARPSFDPQRIQEAIADGRVPAEGLPAPSDAPHALRDATLPAQHAQVPELPGPATAEHAPAAVTGEPGAVTSAPRANPTWSQRIQIVDGPSLVVRGTSGGPHENGLRSLLKQYRFRYQGADREWRYAGRPEDRAAAIGDIRRWLATQDRADAASTPKPAAALPPTDQQQAIIAAYQAGHTIAVQALAGTGKTSTLQMLASTRPQTRVAYIAFNRSIADEAQRKFGRNVRADTSHAFAREALANTPLRGKLARVGQGARWPEEWSSHLHIAVDGADAPQPDSVARMVIATVRNFRESSAAAIGREHLAASVPEGMPDLADAVLGYARAAWQDIADPDGTLLFDHDDYLKLWALGNPRLPYDVIFFDEAQDINDVLRKVIQDQPAQTIVVGDSNQSIYGFRGAIDALKNWPAQVTLPLTQSWRFGPAVADLGNRFLRLLNSPWLLTGNPALDTSIGPVDEPDAVLARTNAGAVAAVFDAFDNGKRVALMGGGRAIEDIAKAANDLQAGRRTKHPELSRFADWDEVRAYVEDGEDAQSLRAFVRLVDRRGADGLLNMVKDLVNEDQTDTDGNPSYDIIVSTVHKAKGREWRRVRIADDFPQPQENLATGATVLPNDEQLRLAYVAVTRARNRLELGSLGWIDEFAEPVPSGTVPTPAARAAETSSCQFARPLVAPSPCNAAELARLDTVPGVSTVSAPPTGNASRAVQAAYTRRALRM